MPAIKGTLHGHQGFLIFMRMLTRYGPFCRSCGIAACRDMSAKTLWQGWWGLLSLIITPGVLIGNLITRIRLGRLAEPIPGAPGVPAVPGRPVLRRAAALGLVIPVVVAAVIVWGVGRDPAYADVGSCVSVEGTENDPDVTVVDCGASDAMYVIVGKVEDTTDSAECVKFPGTVASYTEQQESRKLLLCLAENG
ncbi:LppU/SCO3897 family protein [Micromonospora avicenniae]|uniref:LppU/SCO3897 family protein n=1 Tax=Micromonospora avicenniae TaxID=1198245 RepID=UPI003321A3A3